jgi:hypothetical protein
LRAHEDARLRVGIALHSLRAVAARRDARRAGRSAAERRPVHIHVAEQEAEVDECLRARRAPGAVAARQRTGRHALDARARHALGPDEVQGIAARGAVVGLCPTTEANLGDGLFPLRDFIEAGGRFGIGSDSNVSVSPVEELRWLEYGQRLVARQRNIAARPGCPASARAWSCTRCRRPPGQRAGRPPWPTRSSWTARRCRSRARPRRTCTTASCSRATVRSCARCVSPANASCRRAASEGRGDRRALPPRACAPALRRLSR